MNPTVSVNLCCYNSEKYLEETLQSVFAQTFKDWEFVIVNDGSTDGTEAIIQKHLAAGWPIVYHAQSNAGLSPSRNQALRLSRGKYIAFLDHDDLWLPRHLEAQIEAYRTEPELGLVYTDTIMVRESRDNVVGRLSTQYTPASGEAFYDLVPGVYICPAMVMIRRQVLDDVGWFDESYDFVEESDLFLRIARKYRLQFIAEPLTIYRYHGQNYSRRFLEQQAEYRRFQDEILRRYPDVKERLPALPLQWGFGHHASHLRWHLGQRNYFPALKSGFFLTALTFRSPVYAWRRIANFVARYFSKGRQADWMS